MYGSCPNLHIYCFPPSNSIFSEYFDQPCVLSRNEICLICPCEFVTVLVKYSIYFFHILGEGTPWQIKSIQYSVSYSFPKNVFNPFTWHGVPVNSTILFSSRHFLID